MPKRIVRILPNGREVTWGVFRIDGRLTAIIDEGEADTVRVELTEWLDTGETISSTALTEQSGVTLVKTNNTTSVDLLASGVTSTGEATLRITTSAGRVKGLGLRFRTPEAAREPDAYRAAWW